MKSNGTIGIVVRVSDVKGRDKKGDRFISPVEQVTKTAAYCRAAGYDTIVIEPQDLNVSHTTPLDERRSMAEALRQVEAGQLAGIGVASQDRVGTLMLTRERKPRLGGASAWPRPIGGFRDTQRTGRGESGPRLRTAQGPPTGGQDRSSSSE